MSPRRTMRLQINNIKTICTWAALACRCCCAIENVLSRLHHRYRSRLQFPAANQLAPSRRRWRGCTPTPTNTGVLENKIHGNAVRRKRSKTRVSLPPPPSAQIFLVFFRTITFTLCVRVCACLVGSVRVFSRLKASSSSTATAAAAF